MMKMLNLDHKHCAHQVTQEHIEGAYGAFHGLSQGLSNAFKLLDNHCELAAKQMPTNAAALQEVRDHIGDHSGKLHKAIRLTEDALEEIYLAMSGLASLWDEAGCDVHVPAASMAALITPHIRTISMVREMLQGAAR